MKNNKYKILIVIPLVLIILFISTYKKQPTEEVKLSVNSESLASINTPEEIKNSIEPKVLKKREVLNDIILPPQALVRAKVVVLGKTYDASVTEGGNGYDLMQALENEGNFTFHAKEYPGLGYFIDTINDASGSPGSYWIYYINNKKASVGVSEYKVKDGDVIEWKQEGY